MKASRLLAVNPVHAKTMLSLRNGYVPHATVTIPGA